MELLEISGCDNTERELDLIFVHGLDGDGRSTWQADENADNFWPDWLADDFPTIGVWSMDYQVSSSAWKGHTMPLYDRARDILDRLDLADIGHRPIGFVCHSLGGLLVKQMLRLANDLGNESWQHIGEQTQFIVFLSTPHSGADMANWISHLGTLLRTSVSIKELEAHNPQLLELNAWYRNNVGNIMISIYCEKRPTHGILVVNETSADPGIKGVTPIPQDDDHITICKPANKSASVYLRTKRLISEELEKQSNSEIEQAKELSTRIDKITDLKMEKETFPVSYSGKAKVEFCQRLANDWRQLADLLEIPTWEQASWGKGHEAKAIWEWLDKKSELGKLPSMLQVINRNDLVISLNSNPR